MAFENPSTYTSGRTCAEGISGASPSAASMMAASSAEPTIVCQSGIRRYSASPIRARRGNGERHIARSRPNACRLPCAQRVRCRSKGRRRGTPCCSTIARSSW